MFNCLTFGGQLKPRENVQVTPTHEVSGTHINCSTESIAAFLNHLPSQEIIVFIFIRLIIKNCDLRSGFSLFALSIIELNDHFVSKRRQDSIKKLVS